MIVPPLFIRLTVSPPLFKPTPVTPLKKTRICPGLINVLAGIT